MYFGYGINFILFDNDIVLVKLNYVIEIIEFVCLLCLLLEIDIIENDCVIIGWGIKRSMFKVNMYLKLFKIYNEIFIIN